MKKYLALFAASAALLLVSGCDSSGSSARIQEKSVVFNNLAPWQQQDIQNGIINVGYSTDMVYMALGKPSKIVTSANGEETIWTYNNYFPPTAQSAPRSNLQNPGGSNYASSVESSSAPRNNQSLSATGIKGTAQTSLEVPDLPSDTLHVTFRNGQVSDYKLESEGR